MTALYATGRLLWRPAILIALVPLGLVTALAFVGVPDPSLGVQEATAAARDTLWQFATMVPAGVGFLISLLIRELQHTLLAWTLPGLSRRLRLGKLVVGGIFAAAVAVASIPFADAQVSLAVFGWSLLTFAIGGAMFDPVLSKVEGRGLGIILAVLAFRPSYAASTMEFLPLLTTPLAILGGLAFLSREFSPALARRRPLAILSPTWSVTHSSAQQYWAREANSDAEWQRNLQGSTLDWIAAGAHETFGARKHGYAIAVLVQISIAIVTSYFTGNLLMAAMFPWILVGMSGLQLSSRFLYPINRRERANLFFLSTSTETLVASAAGLTSVGILGLVGVRNAPGDEQTIGEVLTFIAYFVALSPISHWAKIRGAYTEQASGSAFVSMRFFAFHLTFIILAAGAAVLSRKLLPEASMWLAAGAFLLLHSAYWVAVHRHFATKDLVLARA